MRALFLFIPLLLSSLWVNSLNKEEAKAFLFESLSLPDKSDYSEDFYIKNIDASFRAKEEMPWGEIVPDKEFLHFVLPVRVNNEFLDTSRIVFYDALKERVKDLSMEDAILEVNHWCHEHVTYQPSDGRTSSPLSTLSQAIGRCGEESTFTVSALRAVGIPARQIYTPRWAHTDDNHAWVEAWANGKWHFLGACEPEPVLDLAWFNAPASRGLLMTTNVTGKYKGNEEILLENPITTRINVTQNYAPVSNFNVIVTDTSGNPVADAKVNFCIYNYSEFYPAVSKISDSNGQASLLAGHGDMIVWATDGKKFGFAIGNPADFNSENNKFLSVMLDKDKDYTGSFELDIVPPKQRANSPYVSEELKSYNDRRKAVEDSLRNEYVKTFVNKDYADKLAVELNVDKDKFAKILSESRGNHQNIINIFKDISPEYHEKIISLLYEVTEKDRRDITRDAILDHVFNTIDLNDIAYSGKSGKNDIYSKYILNPRIENEHISTWRSILNNGFSDEEKISFRNNPENLIEWIENNIILSEDENPQGLRITPSAIWHVKKADKLSREIFFVAAARTVGIPSRFNSVTRIPEYLNNDDAWCQVRFSDSEDMANLTEGGNNYQKGFLKMGFTPKKYLVDPTYYSFFTISRIEDGIPRLLEFDENSTLSQIFSTPQSLETGQYIITSGQRLANGSVLAHSEIISIEPDNVTSVPLVIREDENQVSVIGNLNAENLYYDLNQNIDKSLLSTTGRGFYVLGIMAPNHEPSEHALNDISAMKSEFEKDGRSIVILFDNSESAERFDQTRFPSLPGNMVFGVDTAGVSQKEIIESLNLSDVSYPIFVIADSFNRIVWNSTGYNIGLGNQILSILSKVE